MLKVREVYESRIPRLVGAEAITLYPFIFYSFDEYEACDDREEVVRAHEWIHVRQIRLMGWFNFYVSYVVCYLRMRLQGRSHISAYYDIPHERQAFKWARRRVDFI